MDVFNRPPTIAEDTLQYILYPGPAFPDKSSVTTLAALIDSHVSSALPNHIWHRDAFELKVVSESSHQDQWHIEGRMRVGDCVDDEWCVVWLLKDISQRWDVVVSVFDSDGEFLLIEAADYLPAWVTPNNSENRVWIYQEHLHLVPLQYVSQSTVGRDRHRLPNRSESDDEGTENSGREYISVSDALKVVRNRDVNTAAPPEMENTVWRKIEGYPAHARQHLHRTKAYVPKDISLALSNNPALIQKATEAFYTRDAIQLRAVTRMSRFPPKPSVLATVPMTRTAYAQLVGQSFHQPKVFGPWEETDGSREWRWRDVGMKIACGFEMLYQESKIRHEVSTKGMAGGDASLEARKDALRRDDEYVRYIQDLRAVGYFNGESEGSTVWNEQENRAAAQFVNARQADNAHRPSFASLVNLAVGQAQSRTSDNPSEPVGEEEEEDTDEWLTVDERTVDGMLANSLRSEASRAPQTTDMDVDTGGKELEDQMAAEQAVQLRALANKVDKFVEGEGDIEGARFEDDLVSDGEDISDFSDSDDESASDGRVNEVEGAAAANRQAVMDRLVPALEPSEYGQMPPSFHSNSQRVKEATMESEIAPIEDPANQDATLRSKPMRPLIFPRDQFDGVDDSDDESEEGGPSEDEEEEESRPTVLGDIEIDMQEEEEEFLKFSREALGISPAMWGDIVRDRKVRGVITAFLPHSALREDSEGSESNTASPLGPLQPAADSSQRRPDSGPRPNANPNLDSFEAVMQAMDAELSRAKENKRGANVKMAPTRSPTYSQPKGKGKQRAEDDDDIQNAMDNELRAALQDASDDDSDERDETPMDYTLIKNFLKSFKSQGGLPGPVGNLVGRLQPGWQLPRDES